MENSQVVALHRRVEAWAAREPSRAAAVCGEDRRDYATLNAQANRLARRLRALGVAPERNVGLCMARGVGMLEGLLAALKAGGAYVPMDPEYPAERLRAMVEDAALAVVLTDAAGRTAMAAALSGLQDAPACVSLEDAADWAGEPAENLDDTDEATVSSRRAYVIYTSGSTGRPKGVEVEHAAVMHLWRSLDAVLHPQGGDAARPLRAAMNASLSFDVSVQGWSRLLSGDCVVMVPQAAKQDPEAMLSLLEAERVDLFDCTPSQLGGLLDAGLQRRDSLHGLTVVVAGEAIPAAMWRSMASSTTQRFFNAYGPTEATVYATAMVINDAGDAPRIGVALPGVRIGVFDEALRPVADGESGELLIAGDGLARGYLARPELTAERFVAIDGERWYRTGDLGRVLADGTIEYQGRNDFQVKVRGFRIELGEIESVLSSLPGVRDAVVLARDEAGDKQLVAYVRGDAEATVPSALREALSTRLPGFMVPSAYVRVEAWPQTVNGKLDRAALRAPSAEDYPSEAYRAPEGEVETGLAALWCELLRREQVGRDDCFLLLGGDSLRLIQLSSRIRQRFGVSLPIHALFRPMTLAEMAGAIAQARAGDDAMGAADEGGFDKARIEPMSAGRAPLSYQQYGLWLLEQLTSTSTAYNAQNVIRIRGRFDADRFGRAIAVLAERHEILRTTFHAGADGEPYQQVHASAPGMFEYREPEGGLDETGIAALIESQVFRRFDLAQLPLAKFTLVRLSADEHLLIQVEQHYVHDGWSMNLILRELLAIYDAMGRGEAPDLPPMVAQFGDYANWQRSEAAAARFRRQARYWKDKLAGAALQLPMITDRPRPAVPSYRGGQVRVELPKALVCELRAFCRREGVTLYAAMQAVFQLTISRYAGCDDFVIGSAVANRVARRAEGLVGMFVNMVPVRCNLSGDPSYRTLLDRVMADLAEAYDHQEAPFEWVVREVQPERDAGRNPLFQVAFSSHNSTGPRLAWPEFTLDIHEVYSNDTSKFDFDVIMIPRARHDPDGVTMLWSYAADLYDHGTIEGIARTYRHLLAACIADPHRPLAAFEACDPDARARLLAFGADVREYDRSTPIHARFEAQAAHAPDAIAVSCGDDALRYGALNARANRLAHWLRAQGVAPESRVAICMERGIGVVESVVAVLKSGGGYVPLDLSYPADRLAYVLADARPTLVLADAAARPLLAEALADVVADGRPRIVDIDDDAGLWAAMPETNPDPAAVGLRPDHLAYVIYTSGSTGEPKGVMVEHRQIDRLFATTASWSGFRADDVVALFHSFAFDFSVWEIWGALRHGGRLVVVPRDVARSADAFHDLLCRERVTLIDQTPGALRALIEAQARSDDRHALRTLIFGGEALDAKMLKPWFADPRNAATRLVQVYGITETTVISTWREMTVADTDHEGPSPIGVRYDDVSLYVLDPQGQLCPFGVVGEIHIGGGGVARGYLDRDALTAERFVADPFRPGERIYRSGDLARMRTDGSLEYVGRNDFQVKVRGYRIELGEIESRLAALPGVRDAVVLARQDAGDRAARLVAYYRVEGDGAPDLPDALRQGLQRQLPEYMLPSAYVQVDGWPLNANGKLDRRALPAPDAGDFGGRAAYVAPRTPIEEEMARIWSQLLGVAQVGVHDNFFALGGHSLLATRLAMATQDALGVDVSLRDLFEGPTIERLLDVVFSRIEQEDLVE
ncbi:amino acid adenylation domain-containing protein [Lysobacter brunescens]|uniref:Amino acid adenylation domain-containing protein n=1 Tax=Lysobacter brunescens TaxID=262323 RepID=A0ABW2Y7D7_9GAMM